MLSKKSNAPISRPCGATEIDARKPMPKYQAAEYLRLSYTDDKSSESDSIQNQKRLIADWLTGHPDIELVSTRIDDGYSGILFDRPDFQRMMDDIMAGRINCVIVKDLSRLGREYIETGRYLRQLFPSYGVRFIAINDDIDTANEHSGDDLIVGVKNLVNDTYCRDISVKTRTALMVKRKNGDYVGACPVYGYQKAPDNKNRLVIDNDAARVVRDIFRRRINGVSARKIADDLNEHGLSQLWLDLWVTITVTEEGTNCHFLTSLVIYHHSHEQNAKSVGISMVSGHGKIRKSLILYRKRRPNAV